jgi:hypothetical protein
VVIDMLLKRSSGTGCESNVTNVSYQFK